MMTPKLKILQRDPIYSWYFDECCGFLGDYWYASSKAS